MVCEQCNERNKKVKKAKEAASGLFMLAGWVFGACSIIGGASLIGLAPTYDHFAFFGISAIMAGIYMIASYTEATIEEIRKIRGKKE